MASTEYDTRDVSGYRLPAIFVGLCSMVPGKWFRVSRCIYFVIKVLKLTGEPALQFLSQMKMVS